MLPDNESESESEEESEDDSSASGDEDEEENDSEVTREKSIGCPQNLPFDGPSTSGLPRRAPGILSQSVWHRPRCLHTPSICNLNQRIYTPYTGRISRAAGGNCVHASARSRAVQLCGNVNGADRGED